MTLGTLLPTASWAQSGNAITPPTPIVRLAELQIDPEQVDAYLVLLREEIDTSVRVEPGVLTLNAVAVKGAPDHVRLMEIYADQKAYETHIRSAHFLKYKNATAAMVKSLILLETTPIALRSKR